VVRADKFARRQVGEQVLLQWPVRFGYRSTMKTALDEFEIFRFIAVIQRNVSS
jgi:hypothetical protein